MEKYTLSGVFKATLGIAQTWIERSFLQYGDRPLKTAYLRNAADMRSFNDIFKRMQQPSDDGPVAGSDTKLTYPFTALTVGQIAPDEFRAGYKQKRYTGGMLIGKDKEKSEATFDSADPVLVTLGAALETDNFDDIIAYVTMFLRARPRITLGLRSDDTGWTTEIGIQPDLAFTIPQADMSTPGDPYKFEHTLAISTYMGVVTTMPLIRSIRVNAQVGSNSSDEFIVDVPEMRMLDLHWYELFDRASPNFKRDYKEIKR